MDKPGSSTGAATAPTDAADSRPWWDGDECDVEASPTMTPHHPRALFDDREPEMFPVVCTLRKGHHGPHVAEDVFGNICGCWPNVEEGR